MERIARAGSERADRVARAKALLAVADGAPFTAAAQAAGRRAGDAVAHLVARFNGGTGGLGAAPRRGATVRYGAAERARILREFRRAPEREQDRTATWSLTTLQRALRRAPGRAADGQHRHHPAHAVGGAGYTWQQSRTWCPTGTALRKRKDGRWSHVTDPDATPKKTLIERAYRTRRGARAAAVVPGRGRPVPGHPAPGPLLAARRATRPASPTSTCGAARPSC